MLIYIVVVCSLILVEGLFVDLYLLVINNSTNKIYDEIECVNVHLPGVVFCYAHASNALIFMISVAWKLNIKQRLLQDSHTHTPVCHVASQQAACAQTGLESHVIVTSQYCHLHTAASIEKDVPDVFNVCTYATMHLVMAIGSYVNSMLLLHLLLGFTVMRFLTSIWMNEWMISVMLSPPLRDPCKHKALRAYLLVIFSH